MAKSATHDSTQTPPDVVIVGGGPAGLMCGLLLARAGVRVTVLEKHKDFLRDFRGDTVHPSTMEVLDQLGMLGRFLERPHERVYTAQIRIDGRDYAIGDLSHLNAPARFIAFMPQWEFLDFLRDEARAFPGFSLVMNAAVADFLVDGDGRIAGARLADGTQLRPRLLTIMCDGRGSLVRKKRLLACTTLGAPMDVLWFRLPKNPHNGGVLRAAVGTGRIAILIDRRDYWQAAFVIEKGAAPQVLAKGSCWIKAQIQSLFPELDLAGQGGLEHDDDVFVLSVALDRLDHWHRPGLLAIGDAAHAMSPIGGVGINLAIQDAVAAANLLAARLAEGRNADDILHHVQRRRLLPTRVIQGGQKLAQERVIAAVLSGAPILRAPWQIRLLNRCALLRRIPGRIIGLGFRRERVELPTPD